MGVIEWKTDHLRKGDVFKDKEDRELLFIGWWTPYAKQGTMLFRSAAAVLYRKEIGSIDDEYYGVLIIPEEDMKKHKHWIGGFMSNEGT